MKSLLFIAILLMNLASVYSQANKPPELPPRKSMSLSPIELVQAENNLNLTFHTDMGTVSISVTAPGGANVYQADTPAVCGTSVVIPTAMWPYGSYRIRIADSAGTIIKETLYYKE